MSSTVPFRHIYDGEKANEGRLTNSTIGSTPFIPPAKVEIFDLSTGFEVLLDNNFLPWSTKLVQHQQPSALEET